jgi:hypothetical protein
LAEAGAEAAPTGYRRRRLSMGRAPGDPLWRRLDPARRERKRRRSARLRPAFRQVAEEAGRDPRSLSVTVAGAPDDPDLLKRYRDLGITRVNFPLPPAHRDEVMPALDRLADLMRQLDG